MGIIIGRNAVYEQMSRFAVVLFVVLAISTSIACLHEGSKDDDARELSNGVQSDKSQKHSETILVAADGTATFKSIQAAVDAAGKNAVIRIAPGEYHGPINVSKPVTLQGAGWQNTKLTGDYYGMERVIEDKEVSSESKKRLDELIRKLKNSDGDEYAATLATLSAEFGPKPVLTITTTRGVVLKGLRVSMKGSVRAGGWQNFPMVSIQDAAVRATDCAFAGSPVLGLQIGGVSQVECRHCLVAGIRASGIVVDVLEKSQVHIADCDIRNCGYTGVTIKGRGRTVVENCRIAGMDFHGIRYDNSSPTVSGNVFLDMNRGGIYANGETHATVKDNLFLACSIVAWGSNSDMIEHNSFVYHNSRRDPNWKDDAAIIVNSISCPSIESNVVSQYRHGVICAPEMAGSLEMKGNLVDTIEEAFVRRVSVKPPPRYEQISLPEGNLAGGVRFADPDDGDYSLADDQAKGDIRPGSRVLHDATSRWPELPEEQSLLNAIADAESREH